VDAATTPAGDHRLRLELAPDAAIAEGSHWYWLQAGPRPADAVGCLLAAPQFPDREAVIDWLREQDLPIAECELARGQFAAEADLAAIAGALGVRGVFPAPLLPGYYDSQAGATLNAFLAQGSARYLIHVNGEIGSPRLAVVALERCAGAAAVNQRADGPR